MIFFRKTKKNENYNFIGKTNKFSPYTNITLKFTVWEHIIINGPLLIKDFVKYFKEEYNFDIDFLISNNKCILDLIKDEEIEENEDIINKTIDELFKQIFPLIYENKKYLKIKILCRINNIEVNLPIIKYIIK